MSIKKGEKRWLNWFRNSEIVKIVWMSNGIIQFETIIINERRLHHWPLMIHCKFMNALRIFFVEIRIDHDDEATHHHIASIAFYLICFDEKCHIYHPIEFRKIKYNASIAKKIHCIKVNSRAIRSIKQAHCARVRNHWKLKKIFFSFIRSFVESLILCLKFN